MISLAVRERERERISAHGHLLWPNQASKRDWKDSVNEKKGHDRVSEFNKMSV